MAPEYPAPLRLVRRRDAARLHWFGDDEATSRHAETLRRQYEWTAQEYQKAALGLYENLAGANGQPADLFLANRNVQLFVAYTVLWDAFEHVYTAYSHTAFALGPDEEAPVLTEDDRIAAVLARDVIPDEELENAPPLRHGETVASALDKLLSRASRDIVDLYGEIQPGTLTDLTAFLDGTVALAPDNTPVTPTAAWTIRALDEHGRPLDLETASLADEYRCAIRFHCRQIRMNLSFVGQSEASIDDALLLIRAFGLLEYVLGILLSPARRDRIFSLEQ